jgi:hypothetical protein
MTKQTKFSRAPKDEATEFSDDLRESAGNVVGTIGGIAVHESDDTPMSPADQLMVNLRTGNWLVKKETYLRIRELQREKIREGFDAGLRGDELKKFYAEAVIKGELVAVLQSDEIAGGEFAELRIATSTKEGGFEVGDFNLYEAADENEPPRIYPREIQPRSSVASDSDFLVSFSEPITVETYKIDLRE